MSSKTSKLSEKRDIICPYWQGKHQDYPQRRLKAKLEKLNQRKQYWTKSGDFFNIFKD